MKNPTLSAKQWRDNLSSTAAQNKAKASVNALQQSPTAQAAANAQKMLAKITDAVNSGRYAAACQAVSLAQWQNAYVTKAIPRFAGGAAAKEQDMATFFAKHNQICQGIKDQARAMPKNNENDALERVRFAMQAMKAAYGK